MRTRRSWRRAGASKLESASVFGLCFALVLVGCQPRSEAPPGKGAKGVSAASTDREGADGSHARAPEPEVPREETEPVRVERLGDLEPTVFVVRGAKAGGRLVFLHGMCGHGLGYAQSFQHAAAKKGTLLAPQADVPCGAFGAKWSMDVKALDQRIVAAFERLGDSGPIEDICVIGMSQGATRAAALARNYPERYTRLVSMGAPTEVKVAGLERLRAAVMMVGSRERKDLMLGSERALKRAGVPTTSIIIPDADHAAMGPHPEQTMDTVLDWLWENARPGK